MTQPTLSTRPCPCGALATEVIHAEQKCRRGWYCGECQEFEPAIGRERVTERGEKGEVTECA